MWPPSRVLSSALLYGAPCLPQRPPHDSGLQEQPLPKLLKLPSGPLTSCSFYPGAAVGRSHGTAVWQFPHFGTSHTLPLLFEKIHGILCNCFIFRARSVFHKLQLPFEYRLPHNSLQSDTTASLWTCPMGDGTWVCPGTDGGRVFSRKAFAYRVVMTKKVEQGCSLCWGSGYWRHGSGTPILAWDKPFWAELPVFRARPTPKRNP